jgi:hypothetical protein
MLNAESLASDWYYDVKEEDFDIKTRRGQRHPIVVCKL